MNLQEYIDELKGTERFKQVGIFSLDQHEYSFSDLKFGNKYVMDTILACSSDPSSFFTNGIYLEKDESGNPINKVSAKNVCFFYYVCARVPTSIHQLVYFSRIFQYKIVRSEEGNIFAYGNNACLAIVRSNKYVLFGIFDAPVGRVGGPTEEVDILNSVTDLLKSCDL